MTQTLPSNRLWLCKGQNPKSADPKITPKGALTYLMRYIVHILPDVAAVIASHKISSGNEKVWD